MNTICTAITGLGIVSPLGNDAATTWRALVTGHSGLGRISHFDCTPFASHVAGDVKNFNPDATGLNPKDLKRCDRFIQLGLAATREAMTQAGLLHLKDQPPEIRQRVAVILASGIGGTATMEDTTRTIAERGPSRISPFAIPAMLINLLPGQVSMMYGALGPNWSPVSACASSAHAIGIGKMLIETGQADIVICGGAEAAVTPNSVGGFAAMRALSTAFNDTPAKASRPFDKDRDGFVIAEGATTLILERADHATARGAAILGTVAGFGQTSDAHHMTSPAPEGEGGQRAMRAALTDAGLTPADIGYINAHATSTPTGDELETVAIRRIFGDTVPVSSTKGATGHLLGATGALEAAFSLLALRHQTLPPTINLDAPSDGCTLDYIPHTERAVSGIRAALSNSFGFGGTNASLVLTL